ncbi:hypothetical protein ES703_83354 [subsurface metagenome]
MNRCTAGQPVLSYGNRRMVKKLKYVYFRYLRRLDSKYLTGFRHLPKPIVNELGLGILGF